MSIIGVPNTTTFSLADVIAAVNPSSNDLQECFNDAISGAFNTTYDESKDELDDFRDYGNSASSQNLVTIANSNYTITTACNATRNYTLWKNRNPAIVKDGDKFWLNSGGSPGSAFPGNTSIPDLEYYGFGSGLNSVKFQIDSSGVVYNTIFCSLPSYTLTDVYYVLSGGGNSTPVDLYYSSTIGNASNLEVGDILYTDSNLENELDIPLGWAEESITYKQTGSTASTTVAGNTCTVTEITITESNPGVISNLVSYVVC